MAGKVQERRKELRARLIEIGERTIAAEGLNALRARPLAQEAGCAVGAIYNVFGDLTDLVLAVNARTFEAMGKAVTEALAIAPDDPVEQLVAMARAYHRFAASHPGLWHALFDVDRPDGESAPDWYLTEMGRLLSYIEDPLRVILPEMGEQERGLFVRGLFSSVHGIVLLGLEDASAGVPGPELDQMLEVVVRRLVS